MNIRSTVAAAGVVAIIGLALYWTYYGSFGALPSCSSQYALDYVPEAFGDLPASRAARLGVIKMTDIAGISETADKVTCIASVRLNDLSDRTLGYFFTMKGGHVATDVTLSPIVE